MNYIKFDDIVGLQIKKYIAGCEMRNSVDNLRTLKHMDFEKNTILYDALQVLLSIEGTSYGIRDDYFNVYHKGNSLMRIEYGNRKEVLVIIFNAKHFSYYSGKVKKSKNGNKAWSNWKDIGNLLVSGLGDLYENMVVFKPNLCEYKKEAKKKYKDPKAKMKDWTLTTTIRNKDDAEKFINDVCKPILMPAVESFIENRCCKKEEISERAYAQMLFKQYNWEQFEKGNCPCLFFSDSEYQLPNNKRELLDVNNRTKPLLIDLDNWPDKFYNSNKEIALFGSPDGVGAFRKLNGNIVPCFIEIKQDTDSYDGNSGIRKHLRDMVLLAKHTMEDRKKEIEFSYLYRNHMKSKIDWSEDKTLLLFIMQTNNISIAKEELYKAIENHKDLGKEIDKYNVDVEFVFTEDTEGKDLISCYQDKEKHFTFKEVISEDFLNNN